MVRAAEIKKLVQPYLDRHNDLICVGRYIYVTPIRHLKKGFVFDHSLDSTQLRPYISVAELASPLAHIGRGSGERLRKYLYGPFRIQDIHRHFWDKTRPETIENLFEALDDELPRLRAIQTFENYHAFLFKLTGTDRNPHMLEFIDQFVPVINGNFEPMREALERNPQKLADAERYQPGLYPALQANDRKAVAKILHEWEAAAAKKLKIEKYWERTPFPLELL